jgi:hypothetical protein
MNDVEMQRRLFAGDRELLAQFRAYGMYAASREEAAALDGAPAGLISLPRNYRLRWRIDFVLSGRGA